MNYSLDFVGGTSTNVTFNETYTLDEIDSEMIPDLEEITDDPNIQVQTVEEQLRSSSSHRPWIFRNVKRLPVYGRQLRS